jgi:Dolichyl-phosphate-mannose-protein mannosyltransferase
MITKDMFLFDTQRWQKLFGIFILAFALRAAVFFFYVQHNERYHQADSMDYHISALMLTARGALQHPETGKPIFWRTPGYPLYLSSFYHWYGLKSAQFAANSDAQKASIWVQIFLCSLTPILAFYLALLLTGSLLLASLVGWIFVFHIGFILATCYLLTDALAMLFFILFLIFLYKSFHLKGEVLTQKHSLLTITGAALSLAGYTWMRPNGEFIALLSILLLLISYSNWQEKLLKIALFTIVFFTCLSPWYIRNHNLTGKWFFCPMSGPYLLAFSAPKIVRRVTQKPLGDCLKYLFFQVKQELTKREEFYTLIYPQYVVPQEFICREIALPWIQKYPHYLCVDWMKEVTKTTFDLYTSQLVAFANNTYTFDPIEEFLQEKLSLALYTQPLHWFARFLCWLELLFCIFLWLGILGGMWIFLIRPYCSPVSLQTLQIQYVWIKTGLLIGGLLCMTGGFGYARLRMPAEPLLIILSLTFFMWLFDKQKGAAS